MMAFPAEASPPRRGLDQLACSIRIVRLHEYFTISNHPEELAHLHLLCKDFETGRSDFHLGRGRLYMAYINSVPWVLKFVLGELVITQLGVSLVVG